MFFQVGVPYIKAKAHDYYEQLGGGIDSSILDDTLSSVRPSVGETRVRSQNGTLFASIVLTPES